MNDALKQAGKWGGIVIGIGIVAYALLNATYPAGCNGSTVRDTVYVTVQGLPDTIVSVIVKPVLRPVPVIDSSRIDSMRGVIRSLEGDRMRQDSLLAEFLVEREGEVQIAHIDTDYVLVGRIPVLYDPISKEFDASLILDSLSIRASEVGPPSCGLPAIEMAVAAILGALIAIWIGG
jgi:hypothetical protein